MGVTRSTGCLHSAPRRVMEFTSSSPSTMLSALANTVITSFGPSSRRLLNERSSPCTQRRSASSILSAASSASRATTFIVSTAPESRRVSTGKMKKRSPLLRCEKRGAAASAPHSSTVFLHKASSIYKPPYR